MAQLCARSTKSPPGKRTGEHLSQASPPPGKRARVMREDQTLTSQESTPFSETPSLLKRSIEELSHSEPLPAKRARVTRSSTTPNSQTSTPLLDTPPPENEDESQKSLPEVLPSKRKRTKTAKALATPEATSTSASPSPSRTPPPSPSDMFKNFIDAYNGMNTSDLGFDAPKLRPLRLDNPEPCVVLTSNGGMSRFLHIPKDYREKKKGEKEEFSWRCHPQLFSQNPTLELSFSQTKTSGEECRFEISSEQLAGETVRVKGIEDVCFDNVQLRLDDAGVEPVFIDEDRLKMILGQLRGRGAIDITTFNVEKGSLWLRKEIKSADGEKLKMRALAEKLLPDAIKVVVIRRASEGVQRDCDAFFDWMMDYCNEKGVYWGYDAARRDVDDCVEVGKKRKKMVIENRCQAPEVSWCKWSKQEWNDIMYREITLHLEEEEWRVGKLRADRRTRTVDEFLVDVIRKRKAEKEAGEEAKTEAGREAENAWRGSLEELSKDLCSENEKSEGKTAEDTAELQISAGVTTLV
ncbi:hypothetical protein B0J14DRAFT_602632 [Halenospora varia]|nr:hypothetical protein B0J14DRAFT_602632 [Halenospora varia]